MKIHPVRASIAIIAVVATVFFLVMEYNPPDAWWASLGMIIAFYFTGD